ncbi:MAG: protein-L-isoaspartate O-methyltransferase, partial [Bacteroidales bacterium]
DKILEVGTGSGYQALTLDWLGADVFSVERQKKLYLKTKQLLTKFKSTVKIFYGDGYLGLPVYAPFDKIIVTCGAPIIPSALIEQLKIGGIMIVPLGEKKQIMTKVIKISDKDIKVTEHGDFNFVPMLSEKVR